ncbi:hypothetical protein FHR90_001881 [Endobacter medicaginis]|uniref:Phosphatidic acid phosphatase type 2/haloperoxidase domain-containing protein n=2 Tax=Endobacter medicaginis TaxID=1181271 RepID=A0A839UZK1_9PROT|nr:phosphatase PAP2 family protein [Endobacter medicaginis]MBB3174045.1 hypothetical protein [Endobacter medicaginis]MCX5477024.1 phosphatase PAP2 family protein [Endobacter medicaginis]
MTRRHCRRLGATLAPAVALGALMTGTALAKPVVEEPTPAITMTVLKGLAPVSALSGSYPGNAALAANYVVTGGIQTGTIRLPTLLPFTEQQQQALRDVFITDGNLAELADGLGTTLGAAYLARAHYLDRTHYTMISPAVHALIAYADATTGSDSQAGKYFFANGTTNGTDKVSSKVAAIYSDINGEANPFGRAYTHLGGHPDADKYGDSRPFQTETEQVTITGLDYFGAPATNVTYNRGPYMDLTNSPSYPSGHTTYGYMGGILLGILVPQRYPQMLARAAEYGTDRIIVGAHYAMDVIGGRTVAMYDMAHLLANDPAYMNRDLKRAEGPIADFQAAVKVARDEIGSVLSAACGKPVAACAREDIGRFRDDGADAAFFSSTLTYSIPGTHPETALAPEDVGKVAPEAGYLLTAAYPSLTLEEADRILTATEGPGGGFLDDGSAFGLYSRLNLYAAARAAANLVATRPAPAH